MVNGLIIILLGMSYVLYQYNKKIKELEKNSNYNNIVLENIKAFKQVYKTKPDISDNQLNMFRVALLEEEVSELKQALIDGDKVEVLDALLDIQYVLSGAVNAFGMQDVFNEGFIRVHESNMSKLCLEYEIASTRAKYAKEGIITYQDLSPISTENVPLYIIFREDGKYLKNINYKAVQLKDLVQ